jgi:hypothetical protein
VERLVEEESLGLNQTVLSNRQAHAELILRLRTREVEQQDTWRGAWEKDLERWRLLRMRHTIDACQACIRSPEFADPPERNEHLAMIKRDEVRLETECYLIVFDASCDEQDPSDQDWDLWGIDTVALSSWSNISTCSHSLSEEPTSCDLSLSASAYQLLDPTFVEK